MSDKDNGGPAFPAANAGHGWPFHDGMTLRDYFAARAMAAQIPKANLLLTYLNDSHLDEIASGAYKLAEAMLRAREA